MNIVERAKNILLTPKTEWPVIAGETATMSSLITSYVIPLASIPAIAALLAGFIISGGSLTFVITTAIIAYATAIISFVVTAYVVDLLAPSFKSEKDLNKSAQLVAYASTASWVAGVLTLIPFIGSLAAIAGGIYAIYLMYLGVGPMKKTPESDKIIYMIIVFIVLIGISMILASVLTMMFLGAVI